MTIAQETTASPSYDPENEGAGDGQLPNPDLVDQLPPPTERKPGGPLDRDKWLSSWGPQLGHAAFKLLFYLNGYANASGICWPSRAALMGQSGMSGSSVDRAIRELKRSGAVDVIQDGKGRKSNTWQLSGGLNDWAKLTESGELNSPKVVIPNSPKVGNGTLSSSNPKINPKDPGVVDAKRVDHVDHPGPEPGVTTGVKISSFEEEGVTGARVTGDQLTVEEVQAWVDGHLSETPQPFEIQQVGKHCWPAWSKHWDLDLAGAIVVWTKTEASRRKFRKDVVIHLPKVGLPKPPVIDPEQERARGRDAAWLDQRIAEGPKRRFKVECAGCGFPRQLKPGETHCHPCRKLSEAPRIASLPGPAIWKADEYEKVIEENLRRFKEAHGPAPEDAKVEAVGAAMASVQGQAAK